MMRLILRWTILVVSLLFVLVGGYTAYRQSGDEEPNPQNGVFVRTPQGPKHVPGSSITVGLMKLPQILLGCR